MTAPHPINRKKVVSESKRHPDKWVLWMAPVTPEGPVIPTHDSVRYGENFTEHFSDVEAVFWLGRYLTSGLSGYGMPTKEGFVFVGGKCVAHAYSKNGRSFWVRHRPESVVKDE